MAWEPARFARFLAFVRSVQVVRMAAMKRYLRFSLGTLILTAIVAAYFGGYRSGRLEGHRVGFDLGHEYGLLKGREETLGNYITVRNLYSKLLRENPELDPSLKHPPPMRAQCRFPKLKRWMIAISLRKLLPNHRKRILPRVLEWVVATDQVAVRLQAHLVPGA